jgi:ATP-dependent DNA helicase DinG
MADAVDEAFAESRHLIIQAGTGTGKSLAYLVPAAKRGRPVLIATATKALQEQLGTRDLPLVAQVFGDLSVAVLKGRSNYACRQRTAELAERGFQVGLDDAGGDPERPQGGSPSNDRLVAQVERLLAWERRSATGDRSELDEGVSDRAWSMVSTGPRECPGAFACPQGGRCFAEMARQAAAEADVIVVNIHLLGSHLASGGQVLPEHDAIVIDEAHELEEIMTQCLGVDLTPGRIRSLASLARPLLTGAAAEAAVDLTATAEGLGSILSALPDSAEIDLAATADLSATLNQLDASLRGMLTGLRENQEGADPRAARALSSATRLIEEVGRIRSPSVDEVLWVEGPRSTRSLNLSPIDVGPALQGQLFEKATVVMTSATIPPRFVTRLGLGDTDVVQLDVGSPFDFKRQSMLYVPTHLADRRSDEAEEQIATEIALLIEAAGGRTLSLFTSRRAMNEAADRVADQTSHPVLVQGAAANRALIDRFRDEEDACLFATMGMWQGLDIQGPSLSLVTIDRLPFGRPDDPLLEARRRRAGSGAFMSVDVPRAATLLAQGVGRLIRSATDRGVVAVLDDRLAKAGYRNALLNALPDMKRSIDRLEVLSFLREIAAEAD